MKSKLYSPAFSAIILYILFVLIIALTKPSLLYDHTNNKFKELSYENPLNIISVGIITSFVLYSAISLIN